MNYWFIYLVIAIGIGVAALIIWIDVSTRVDNSKHNEWLDSLPRYRVVTKGNGMWAVERKRIWPSCHPKMPRMLSYDLVALHKTKEEAEADIKHLEQRA